MRTRAVSIWDGETRPRPADLRDAAYDLSSAPALRHKLLICAAPRCSSKRLARVLIGAGLGVPIEYFNAATFGSLTARAERMLRCDDGPYRGHETLKARLREYLPA